MTMGVNVARFGIAVPLLAATLAFGKDARADALNRAKGITGCAMLGAEVVLMTEAALGVEPAWAYLVGGAAGAGAGAFGGYYLGGTSSAVPSSWALAGGIALVIPTMIAVVAATSFDPPDHFQIDDSPEEELEDSELLPEELESSLELPTLGVAQAFSAEELHTFGGRQATELHVTVLRGTF